MIIKWAFVVTAVMVGNVRDGHCHVYRPPPRQPTYPSASRRPTGTGSQNTGSQNAKCAPQESDTTADAAAVAALQNLTATIASILEEPLRIHVTHDYQNCTSSSPPEVTNKEARPTLIARDCNDIAGYGYSESGVYMIKPEVYPVSPKGRETEAFAVHCDMETEGGNWTVFQRRLNGLVDFYRSWEEYKEGFGYLNADHWLGLQRVHQMTATATYELRVELVDWEGIHSYAKYDNFQLGDEGQMYKLLLGYYKGTAGDSLSYHNNMAFSTKDQDNDPHTTNCARRYKGAWWYKDCFHSNLNGLYLSTAPANEPVMNWYKRHETLKKSEMKIRRVDRSGV